jgi:hypothetical protein
MFFCTNRLAAESFYASGDRLLIRWFDEDKLGFAFGCVFATGEFGGALAFYMNTLVAEFEGENSFITIYLVGTHAAAVPQACVD